MNLKEINFKKLFSQNKKSYSFVVMSPHRDWKMLTSVAAIFVFLIFIAGIYFWNKLKNEDIFSTNMKVEKHTEDINQDLMQKILKNFEEKANKKDAFPQKPEFLVDPNK